MGITSLSETVYSNIHRQTFLINWIFPVPIACAFQLCIKFKRDTIEKCRQ